MAKRKKGDQKTEVAGPPATPQIEVARTFVVHDPKVAAAVPVDFASLTLIQDFAIHSLYQTQLPIGVGSPADNKVECVLVGRFQYGPETLKALASLLMRQFIVLETSRGKKVEAVAWLEQVVREHQAT